MAVPIITALRQRDDLKESVLHTAQELAHRASIYGVVRVSYTYLAQKCHCSRRTVMRHIQRLIEAKIIRKTVIWITGNFCEINQYSFVLSWDKRPHKGGSDTLMPKSPLREEGEKNSGVREKLENQRKFLRTIASAPGSYAWKIAHETIAQLEAQVARE